MSESIKADCPECRTKRNAIILGEHVENWHYEDGQGNSSDGQEQFRIVKCGGCDTIYFQRRSSDSEDFDVEWDAEVGSDVMVTKWRETTWPEADASGRPSWLSDIVSMDRLLYQVLNEAYSGRQYRILAAVGLRTALDRATMVLGIDPAITFGEKLDALLKGGWIGASEHDTLSVLTDAGNAAAHRAWHPTKEHLDVMFTALELFIQKAFIFGSKADDLKRSLPKRQKRRPPAKAKNTGNPVVG